MYIYIIHYITINQSQGRIRTTWSDSIIYISFTKSYIGQFFLKPSNIVYMGTTLKRGRTHAREKRIGHLRASRGEVNENENAKCQKFKYCLISSV